MYLVNPLPSFIRDPLPLPKGGKTHEIHVHAFSGS